MTVSVNYSVYGMSQPTADTCWITALTVMVNWRHGAAWGPEQVCEGAGTTLQAANDTEGWGPVYEIAGHYGIHSLDYTPADVEAWAQAMSNGPLWLVVPGNPSHAIVLHRIEGDGTFDGTEVTVTDSWNGVETKTFDELMQFFGAQSGQMAGEVQIMAFR
jgi:hypothetical protein